MENLDVIKPESIVEIANNKGQEFKNNGIKTNQIRNFFAAVLSIKNKVETMTEDFNFEKIKPDLILLKPKIAYAAGRQTSIRVFKDFVDELIEAMLNSKDKEKAVQNFFVIIESVVAYHKFYGGRDN